MFKLTSTNIGYNLEKTTLVWGATMIAYQPAGPPAWLVRLDQRLEAVEGCLEAAEDCLEHPRLL